MKAIEAAKAAMIKARDVCLESCSPRSADEMVTFMLMPAIRAYLAALAEDGWKLVPVEASYDLEFARMADGTVKVGYNPRTEEGGWTLVGDVTKSVIAIEAQRDQALRDLDAANQRLSNVFAALAALRDLKETKP